MDRGLLNDARRVRAGTTDSQLIDEALTVLLARERAAEIDESHERADGHARRIPMARDLHRARWCSHPQGMSGLDWCDRALSIRDQWLPAQRKREGPSPLSPLGGWCGGL